MCGISKSRVASQRMLGCGNGAARHQCSTGPRAREQSLQWSELMSSQESQEPQIDDNVLGAVDLDMYGAFQFCAIGILAAVRRHPARMESILRLMRTAAHGAHIEGEYVRCTMCILSRD